MNANIPSQKGVAEPLSKKDPAVMRVKARLDELYAEGRTTSMSGKELHAICRELAPELYAG